MLHPSLLFKAVFLSSAFLAKKGGLFFPSACDAFFLSWPP